MLPRTQPIRLRLVRSLSSLPNDDYIYELKHDGFRAIAYIESGKCNLVSRNAKNLQFASLKKALGELPVKDAVIDGEVVCLDKHGVSQFTELFHRNIEPAYYAFDLLWLDGHDLRREALVERKHRLQMLVNRSLCERLLYAQHVVDGARLFEAVCKRDLEGVVAKRKDGIYKDSTWNWLKIKNPEYSQKEGRGEMLKKR